MLDPARARLSAAARFAAWLDGLPTAARDALGRRYAEAAVADGAYVVLPSGEHVAIPAILTPAVVEPAEMAVVAADAHAITRALVRVSADLMRDPAHAPLRQRLFGAFTPLEARALDATWALAADLVTVRVDFLRDTAGRHRALEVNATIPAMQGYSDAIAAAFLREVAAALGHDGATAEALVAANGRNSDELLASLLAHHQRLGGSAGPQRIAIVARAGDAQRGELEHYQRRWQALGHEVVLANPSEARIVDGRAEIAGQASDVIYRHVFARRLEADSDFARMCLEPRRFHLFNPISSHLEVKAMLALLSAGADDERAARALGLDDEERAAVARAVPWTRLVAPGPTRGPSGEPIADLPAWLRAHGERLVLKRSWDYGGKGVFLGAELAPGSPAAARLAALVGDRAPAGNADWGTLVDFALGDGDAWVAQELVPATTEAFLRVEPDGVHERTLWADLSAFTNTGAAARPTGGAVRAASSRIVNILGGGGLAPLVRADVLARLLP